MWTGCRDKWICGRSTADWHAPAAEGHCGPAGACAAAAVGDLDGEATLWCAPVRATSTPARTVATPIPATAHTHFGGRGQPPNSTMSSDGTAHPRPHGSAGAEGWPCASAGQPARHDLGDVSAALRCATIRAERVRDIRAPPVLALAA